MLRWLKCTAPLQGSVWFADRAFKRPEEMPLFHDTRVARGAPEWRDGKHWRMTAVHPQWGSMTLMGIDEPPQWAKILANFFPFTESERAAIHSAQSALYVEMPAAGNNVLHERKTLLRALSAIGGAELVAAVDHMAQRLWTAADLRDELAHNADLDVESAMSAHAVVAGGEKDAEWLHTHGLAELGGFDFHILRPAPGREFNALADAIRALAGMILEGRAKPDGAAFPLLDTAEACFVPTAEFLAKAEGHAPAVLRRNIEGDEAHGQIAAVLCEPRKKGLLGKIFGGSARPRAHEALWSDPRNPALIAYTDGMTALMAERARATYPVLQRLAEEFASFQFPIGIKLGYEAADGDREHLWFRPISMSDDSIEATLENQPFAVSGMKLGDRGMHKITRISDWMIGTPAGQITPRSQVAARIIREHPDEIRAVMAAGWPA